MARLRVLVENPDRQAHVLAGLGGTGKSTVALQLAEEAGSQGRRVWWVPAGDAETMMPSLLGLAQELGAPIAEVEEAQAGRRNAPDLLWRFLENSPKWLLVFDNVDDIDVLALGGADVGEGTGWIRPTVSGLIVITSRVSDPHLWGRRAEIHTVGWLDVPTGAQILVDLAPRAGPMVAAAALASRLGGLPLALHHAGLHLSSGFAAEATFSDYLHALDDRFAGLMDHGPGNDRTIVTNTWELSLNALAAKGRPQARPLLRVLSCLAPGVVVPSVLLDLEVLARVCEDREYEVTDGLEALSSVGLITASAAEGVARPDVMVHPLVAATNRLRLDGEDSARMGAVAVALLTTAVSHLESDSPGDWPRWLQLVPHLNSAYGYLTNRLTDSDLANLANVSAYIANAFLWSGSYLASEDVAETALRETSRLGADHVAVLNLRSQLGGAYDRTGRHAEAEKEYRDVLAGRLRVLGPDHSSTMEANFDLGSSLSDQGKYAEAEKEYRDALTAQLRVLGPDSHSTLNTRYELARIHSLRGKYAEAEKEYRDTLTAQLRVLGPDHLQTLTARQAIATVHADQGKYAEAEKEYRDTLIAQLRVLGPDHPITMITRSGLAAVYARQGKYAEAEKEYRDALTAQLRVLGPDHPNTLTTKNQYAMLAGRSGRGSGWPVLSRVRRRQRSL